MFIIKLQSQHVSGIIMPIIRRTRVCTAAYGVLHWLWWLWFCGAGTRAVCTARVPAPHSHSHHYQCRTPYAVVHTLVLLTMGIMVPETCWVKSLIINIKLVASCWFFSLFTLRVGLLAPRLLRVSWIVCSLHRNDGRDQTTKTRIKICTYVIV